MRKSAAKSGSKKPKCSALRTGVVEPSRRAWRWWAVGVLALAVLIGGAIFGRQAMQVRRLHAGVPPMPDVSFQPAAFATALGRAQEKALSFSRAREGVEELGRLYHATGYPPEAETCWQALQAAEPREPRWHYYLADARRMVGDEAGMKPFLETTVRLAPEYAPAWLKLAGLAFVAGELDEAETDYRQRLKLIPEDPYAALGLARVALQRGRKGEARKWLEQCASSSPPALPSCHNLLADLLAEEGDAEGSARERWLGTAAGRFREADDPWIDELATSCYDINRLLVLGAIDFQTKHGDHGRRFFERAIELAPEDPSGYEELGRVYCTNGDGASARDVLERGVKQAKASTMLYVRLSEAYCILRQPGEALRVAHEGLALMPGEADLFNALGVALDLLGRHDEAITAFRSAMTDGAHSAEANLNIALSLVHAGRKEEAYEYLHRALSLQPKFPKALAELGYLELDAWRLESAGNYIREFYNTYPGSARARGLMTQLSVRTALAATREGKLEAAERACRDGLKINPDSADLHAVLGTLCAHQKRFAEAVTALETSRRLSPGDPRVLVPLADVYTELGRFDEARHVLVEGEQRARRAGDAAASGRYRELLDRLPR